MTERIPYALDAYGRRWTTYVREDLEGVRHIRFHLSGADTDAGDLSIRELDEMCGPLSYAV